MKKNMDKKIIALTDYKNKFGSKHFDNPYRSGMDKEQMKKYFKLFDYEIKFKNFFEISINDNDWQNRNVIYTSSEDIGFHYKSYIEDIILGLEEKGANLIPKYKYLRANNNKVFMEIIRSINLLNCTLEAELFGSLKDLLIKIENIKFPAVLKASEGASGRNVFLVKDRKDLIKKVKKLKNYSHLKEDIRDYFRSMKHKGYIRESIYRNKFIIQEFIPNLKNDWKVYVFGDKYFIFKRPILKGRGIKASGGGYDNYFYGKDATPPVGVFSFCEKIFKKLNVPHLSLDIAFDGNRFYLIEFQALYFGTAGIPYSKGYFTKKEDNTWMYVEKSCNIEQVYVESIVKYIENK